jgi:hypothetical protein
VSINRYAKRRDANEREIIEALEGRGHMVKQDDFVDLVVQRPDGKIVLLEVKTHNGRLTKSQEQMLGEGWLFHIVRTPAEAIAAVEREEFEA